MYVIESDKEFLRFKAEEKLKCCCHHDSNFKVVSNQNMRKCTPKNVLFSNFYTFARLLLKQC